MSFYRNILSNAGSSAIGSALQMALILGLSRWISPDQFAAFITATAIVGFGEMASDFGTRIWATRQFAIKKTVKQILRVALTVKLLFSILLIVVIVLIPINLLSTEQAFIAALIACTQPSTDPLLWFLRGKERLDIEAVVTLVWRLFNAAVIAVFAYLGHAITDILLIWLMFNLVRITIEWFLPALSVLRKKRKLRKVKYQCIILWSVIKQAFPIGVAFIAMALYQRLGVLILGEVSEPETVAHFGAAFMIVASLGFVATSITVSSFPKLARAVNIADWDDVARITNHKMNLIMYFFLPSCAIGIFIAPWIIGLLYPVTYLPAAAVMSALLPGLYISCINLSLKYLMNTLHHNWMDVISVISGMIIFSLIIIFSRDNDLLFMAGTAWGLGELSIFCIKWWVIRRNKDISSIRFSVHLIIFLSLLGLSLITRF